MIQRKMKGIRFEDDKILVGISKLDSKGRLTIEKRVREALNIDSDTSFAQYINGSGEIVLCRPQTLSLQ